MSNRYWLLGLAIGGWLAVGLLGAGVAKGEDERRKGAESGADNSAYEQPPTQDLGAPQFDMLAVPPSWPAHPSWLVKQEKQQSGDYRPNCENPSDHEEADFCQQRRSADAAVRAADEAAYQASVSLWRLIAIVATFGANAIATFAAVRAANAARLQTQITQRQLVMISRPRLRVRNVVVHHTNWRDPLFKQNILGQAYVSNIGDTKAEIRESHIEVFASQGGLPMRRPYEGEKPNNPVSGILEAGQSHVLILNCLSPFATIEEAGRGESGFHPLFVMGWVSYADDNGTLRRTAFCRRWDASQRRFVRIEDDPDYEHEE
jgi:hypothetical protein